MNVLDRINYRNDLTSQPVRGGYLVLYTTSGSNPCACVIENDERFVVDTKTYYALFESFEEALYVASFINSSILSQRIKNLQSQGLFGARDIHKLIVQQPIPKYDPENELHRKIVEVAKEAIEKANKKVVKEYLKDVHSNRIRTEGRNILEFELYRIDYLIAKILGEEEPPPLRRLCLFVKTDIDQKKFISKLKKLLKDRNIDAELRTLPLEVAIIKYEIEEMKDKDYSLAIEFTENIIGVEKSIKTILEDLKKAKSIKKAIQI